MKLKEKVIAIRKYSWYLFKHRTFAMFECFKEGLIWRGLVHDLSKLRPDEFFPYAYHFYNKNNKPKRESSGYYKPYNTGNPDFDVAWLKHCRRNSHHWQFWAMVRDGGDEQEVSIYEMPNKVWREMICDWKSASRAQKVTGTIFDWYEVNKDKLRLHPETRKNVEAELERRKCQKN